jgi:hypothetical protein
MKRLKPALLSRRSIATSSIYGFLINDLAVRFCKIIEGKIMISLDQFNRRFAAPQLTRARIAIALAIAVIADSLQIVLLPLEWAFVQQIVDVVAMLLTVLVLGFHPLLLPTFVVEFIPVVDMLPTWTGCVVAVIALRRRRERAGPEAGAPHVVDVPPSQDGKSIDQKLLP